MFVVLTSHHWPEFYLFAQLEEDDTVTLLCCVRFFRQLDVAGGGSGLPRRCLCLCLPELSASTAKSMRVPWWPPCDLTSN